MNENNAVTACVYIKDIMLHVFIRVARSINFERDKKRHEGKMK